MHGDKQKINIIIYVDNLAKPVVLFCVLYFFLYLSCVILVQICMGTHLGLSAM